MFFHTKWCKLYIYGEVSRWCTLYLLPAEQHKWLNIYVKVWTERFRWSCNTRIAHGRILHTHLYDKFYYPIRLLQTYLLQIDSILSYETDFGNGWQNTVKFMTRMSTYKSAKYCLSLVAMFYVSMIWWFTQYYSNQHFSHKSFCCLYHHIKTPLPW